MLTGKPYDSDSEVPKRSIGLQCGRILGFHGEVAILCTKNNLHAGECAVEKFTGDTLLRLEEIVASNESPYSKLNAAAKVVEMSPLSMAHVSATIDKITALNEVNTHAKFVLSDMGLQLRMCVHDKDAHGVERMERAIVMQQRVVDFLEAMEKQAVRL